MGVIRRYKQLIKQLVRSRRKTVRSHSEERMRSHEEEWKRDLDEMDKFLSDLEKESKEE